MSLTERQRQAAEYKASLYGVRFEGMQPKKGKFPRYTWTDLVTGDTFLTQTIKGLPDKIIAVRKRFANSKRGSQTAQALELSRKFYGFDPRTITKVNLEWPRSLVCIGAAAQVDYVSDKFDGVVRRYFHEFKSGAVVYVGATPQKDGSNLIIIHGKFKIRPEGITG